jgi:hypothetical protein
MEGQVANNGHNDIWGVRAGREFIQSPISWEGQVATCPSHETQHQNDYSVYPNLPLLLDHIPKRIYDLS